MTGIFSAKNRMSKFKLKKGVKNGKARFNTKCILFFADIFSGPHWVLLAVRYDSKHLVQAKYDFGVYLEKFSTCYHESL